MTPTAPRHPAAPRRLSISLPLLIAIVVIASMFIIDAVLMWQGWQGGAAGITSAMLGI